MTEVQKSEPKDEPTGAQRARLNKKVWQRKERYHPTDADRAAYNQQAQRPKERRVAPRHNEAGPGDADPARTEVPKSGLNCEPTDAERAALSNQAQRQKEQSATPRFSEAGLGDADRAMTEVPEPEPKYEPTDAERAALDRQAQRQKEQSPAPRFNVVGDYRGVRVEQDHPDIVVAHSLLKDALGTADDDFCRGLLAQLCDFLGLEDSAWVETEFNFLLSVIKNGKPKDELHAMLLAQMGVASLVQMRTAQNFRRIQADSLRIARDLPGKDPFVIRELASFTKNLSLLLDSAERSFNRFARTYCMQLEASDRHRRSGEPSMTVQQLTVALGGQAIVGNNFTHATPQTAPNNPTPGPRALTDQQHMAMPIIGDPDRVAVPLRRRKKQ